MRLRYTRRAARQLEAVLAYIAERSPQGAQNVMDRLEAAIDLGVDHPRRGALTGNRGLRRIVSSPYPYLISIEKRRTGSSFTAFAMLPAVFRSEFARKWRQL